MNKENFPSNYTNRLRHFIQKNTDVFYSDDEIRILTRIPGVKNPEDVVVAVHMPEEKNIPIKYGFEYSVIINAGPYGTIPISLDHPIINPVIISKTVNKSVLDIRIKR